MTKTMKAAVVRKFKQPLVIEEVPVPSLKALDFAGAGDIDGRIVIDFQK